MIRRLFVACLFMVCSLFALQVTFAAEVALVKLEAPQSVSISAGERVSFHVVLLAQGQFDGPTYFDLPEIDGAIVMQASERPVLGTQQIGGETYVSARYDFTVYAQRAGASQIAPITARFGSKKSFNQPAKEHRLQTEPFDIKVAAPPGAIAGEIIVSARELNATETWSPLLASDKPAEVKVGDAFTRTITVRARDVPAMMLPPPKISDVAGFAVYPQAPQVKDNTQRGDFTGERIDSVTYICERAGSFEIPELSMRWWDPDKKQWQSKQFPAVKLKVADNPQLTAQSGATAGGVKKATDIKTWMGWIILIAAFAVILYFAAQPLKQSWQAWRKQRAASEAAQWQRLRKACDRGDTTGIYRELNRWLAHFALSSNDLTTAHKTGETIAGLSDNLRESCIALQKQLTGLNVRWEPQLFFKAMIGLRESLRVASNSKERLALPPLNPMGMV